MILISDLHLEDKTADIVREVLARTYAAAMDTSESIGILGDTFMIRHQVQVRLMNILFDFILQCETGGVEIDVLPGNHDQVSFDGRNAMEVFGGFKHVRVHTQPEWTADGLWIPYLGIVGGGIDIEAVKKALKLRKKKGAPKVAFAHLPMTGAWMNNLIQDPDGVDPALFFDAGFKQVFLGHYHRHHTVARGMEYVGSSYQVTYAEAGQEKGYIHWDGKQSTFHAWDIGPRYHRLVVDADAGSDFELPDVREGDSLWVTVKGRTAGVAHELLKSRLSEAGIDPARIDVDYNPTTAQARIELNPDESMTDLAERYVAAQEGTPAFKKGLMRMLGEVTS